MRPRRNPSASCPSTPGPAWEATAFRSTLSYLSWKAREFDFYTKFIELAAEVNSRHARSTPPTKLPTPSTGRPSLSWGQRS